MNNIFHIHIKKNENFAKKIAAINIEHLASVLKKNEEATWVLSGGNTPIEVFREIVKNYSNAIDWRRVVVFWSDERFVEQQSEFSNYGMAKRELLDHLPIEKKYPVIKMGSLIESAKTYETQIRTYFHNKNPIFDVMFLGVGTDGHIASLFPNSNTLINTLDWVVYDDAVHLPQPRISLSLNCLNNGQVKIFGIGNKEKSSIVTEALKNKSKTLPLSMLHVENRIFYFIYNHSRC